MAVNATRQVNIVYTGDVAGSESLDAAANASSPGQIQIIALASGANTITPPAGATAVTIKPPSGNAVTLTLKGVTGDTGVGLHLTDPTSIALASAASTFCLTTSNTVTVRFFWT
jgi:hypothetical protein